MVTHFRKEDNDMYVQCNMYINVQRTIYIPTYTNEYIYVNMYNTHLYNIYAYSNHFETLYLYQLHIYVYSLFNHYKIYSQLLL